MTLNAEYPFDKYNIIVIIHIDDDCVPHRFMKLRLDRVLTESFEADSLEEALAYNPVKLEFEKPANWVAPYPKYESEWWGPFLPPSPQKQ